MTRDQLLARANAFAVHRYGVRTTARTLKLWAEEGLLPGPRRERGVPPNWQWSHWAYRRVLQICRLKGRGQRRDTEWVLSLWLAGNHMPEARVREALVREYERARKRMSRTLPAGWDPRLPAGESRRSVAAVIRAVAAADDGEAAWRAMPRETHYAIARLLYGAADAQEAVLSGVLQAFNVDQTVADGSLQLAVKMGMSLAIDLLLGIGTDPDESELSMAETILHATPEELNEACCLAEVLPWLGSAIIEVLPTIAGVPDEFVSKTRSFLPENSKTLTGRLQLFTLALRLVESRQDYGKQFGVFARDVVRPLRRIDRFIRNEQDAQALLRRFRPVGQPLLALLAWAQRLGSGDTQDKTVSVEARQLRRLLWRHGLQELLRQTRRGAARPM